MNNKDNDGKTLLADLLPLEILIAEDHFINQKLGLKVLEKLGYKADVAGNGKEVIEACDQKSYDLILMDVVMPLMDGLEATRHLSKKYKSKPGKPVIIAITAHAMPGEKEKCLKAGMDDYMVKPLLVDKLKPIIEAWGVKILKEKE